MNLSDDLKRIWLRIETALTGTGSADLGKEEGTAYTSGDKGIMSLGVRTDTPTARASDGQYNPLQTGEHGDLNVDIQHHKEIDACNATTGWTALGNDTTGLTTSTNHVFGTASLEFDKVDGGANTIFGGIQRGITSLDVEPYIKEGGGFFLWSMNVSSLTDIVYAFIRFGTSSSHYNEWRIPVADLNTGWNNLRVLLSAPETTGITGNGWNTSAVTYVAIGCAFSAETDTLANIRIDQIRLNSGLQLSDIGLNTGANTIGKLAANSGVDIGDVDVTSVPADPFGVNADALVAAGAEGSLSAKQRRMTQGLEDLKTLIVLATGSNAIGKLAANSGVDIGDVDVTSLPADPLGANADAIIAAGAAGSHSAKLRRLTQGVEDLKTLIVLAAGENHLGSVAGNSEKISNTITTTNGSAYTAEDNIGGINTITNALRTSGGTEVLMDILIWDKHKQNAALQIDYWNASPSGTYTNDAGQVIAGDFAKWLGTVEIVAGDYKETGAVGKASLKNLGIVLKGDGSRNIFFTIKTTGTPTYTSTSGLIVSHGFLQD